MKKILWIYITALVMVLLSCNNQQQNNTEQASTVPKQLYTCSMHPQIIEDHPGNCPICGMRLIKMNQQSSTVPASIQLESLIKPVNEFVVSSLPVTTLQQKNSRDSVQSFGAIEYDARATGTISARVAGRIEKLYIRYRYEEVEKGQKIMDIYSPELLTAQQNLLFLLSNDTQNIGFIKTAKEKLLLLGMSDEQLKEVIQSGKPSYTVSIYSDYSGHVHEAGMDVSDNTNTNEMQNASMVTEELSLKEGMYVEKGQALFMIMSHHQAWAALQIYSQDESLIKVGNLVRIIPEADTTNIITGQIDFIEPFFRSNSKTLTARVYFHNAFHLPVGSHVTARIYTNGAQASWLPQSAVISLGLNSVVFLKDNGGFRVHKIITGIRNNNDIQILSGLAITDTVAVNAAYLIDSESFIKSSSN
ncbi:MAG TPA: efflux RND transporter periplasmic adaptor subunit [Ferruginibacter sp.]|jgi:Cu(I)/Ag(I) efflux system membrane fusion protein|nr:efflux RND transporter periplasmic adaptor subunit [Ferruginibacter sp.]